MTAFIGFVLFMLELVVYDMFDSGTKFDEIFRSVSSFVAVLIFIFTVQQWNRYKKKLDELLEKDHEEYKKRLGL